MNRRQKIIVSVVGIFIVLLALIGLTYGYFLTRITGNPTSASISVDTANLAVKYSEDTNVVQGSNDAIPGYTVTKTFNVENIGDGTAEYSVKLKDIVSTFSRVDDWIYTLKRDGNTVASGTIPTMDTKVLLSVEQIEVGDKHSYELILEYIEADVDQSEDMGKTIYMTVNIDASMSTWNEVKKVSRPKLAEGMIPVKWDDTKGKWIVCSETDSEWYDYNNKKWANVMLSDGTYKDGSVNAGQEISIYETGSMFVWIPRYEYKIDSTNYKIDVNFIPLTQETASSGYLVHPAFTDVIDAGGWDTELNGIWFAKYQAGYQANTINEDLLNPVNKSNTVVYSDYNYTSTGQDAGINDAKLNAVGQDIGPNNYANEKISYPVFKASTYTYNLINIGDVYNVARDMARSEFYGLNNADSHLTKNSEWGAAAYLAHSKYGRNGVEVSVNSKNANPGKTNAELLKIDVYTMTGYTGDTKAINNETSDASTTGNMTGVFDMSGASNEFAAGYTPNGHENLKNGASFVSSLDYYNGAKDTKYVNIYPYTNAQLSGTTDDAYITYAFSHTYRYYEDMDNHRYGEAILEVSERISVESNIYGVWVWHHDAGAMTAEMKPFFTRGGRMDSGNSAGIFAFSGIQGMGNSSKTGFRTVLVVE